MAWLRAWIALIATTRQGRAPCAGAFAPTLRCRYPARPGQAGTDQEALSLRFFCRFAKYVFRKGLTIGCAVATFASTSNSASIVPSCVQASPHSRYLGFAWDHFVTIRNGCIKQAACTVTTNDNPDPIDVTVPARKSYSVLTYRASPSRDFSYELTCKLK